MIAQEESQKGRWIANLDRDYVQVTGKHAEHFLRRLDRLPGPQVDTALALYRDDGLVKMLLNNLDVAERTERVAISLADPVFGPFIIVTRDGRFVTCLGQGMRVSDIPVVTRQQFERAARKVQRVREILAEIELHPRREVERVLKRILERGTAVSREDFTAIAAWQPLLAPTMLQSFARLSDSLGLTYQQLARRQRRFKSKDEPALHRYWCDSWALAHHAMLLGADGGEYLRTLRDIPECQSLLSRLCWPMTRLNVTCHGLRGAWLAAKIGKSLVAPMKEAYNAPATTMHIVNAGIALSAVGHAHKKLQPEVGKILGQTLHVPDGPLAELTRFFHRSFSAHFRASVEHPELARKCLNKAANPIIDMLLGRPAAAGSQPRTYDDARSASIRKLATTLLLQAPFPLVDEGFDMFRLVSLALPALVRLDAEDFYTPVSYMRRCNWSWSVESSLRLLEPRRKLDQQSRAAAFAPQRAVERPGRNEPCPCRSNKKYKHCCANRVAMPEQTSGIAQNAA